MAIPPGERALPVTASAEAAGASRNSGRLEAREVTKRYGAVVALGGVSLDIRPGETVALVGESGSGKTTLLRCFNRMVEPDSGTVRVDGVDVLDTDPIALRRSVGYVQQEGGLMPHWSVVRNAALVPWLRGEGDADARAEQALELVGLPPAEFGSRWPRELSGGQRQRVAIARALAARPAILLMDEPFGALDAITRAELHEAFLALRQAVRTTTVLVTHDVTEALKLGDRVVVMQGGGIDHIADAGTLLEEPGTDYVRRLLERAGVR